MILQNTVINSVPSTFYKRKHSFWHTKLILAFTALLVLSGAETSHADKPLSVEDYFANYPQDKPKPFFLVESSINEPIPVAVFYGYQDNEKFCNELLEMYMARYPLSRHNCIPAKNK